MAEALVAIPVLGRPGRVKPLLECLDRSRGMRSYDVLFLVSPGDKAERAEIDRAGAAFTTVPWDPGPADWARKLNLAYRESSAPWLFTGADDLNFQRGWLDAALAVAEQTGAGVVGTCDGGRNPRVAMGEHSTHSLVARWYADEHGTVDGRYALLSEHYDHQYADDELVETAKARGLFAFAPCSLVLHDHPYFGRSQMDSTYEKALRATIPDRDLFESRRPLWERS